MRRNWIRGSNPGIWLLLRSADNIFGRSHELYLESGYGIRTVQELPGHKNVKITMICTHVLNRGGMGVKSSVDNLQRRGEGVFDLPRV